MTTATAPGKIILLGEHAVVYGQPALAVPVTRVQATATLSPAVEGIWIEARDLGRRYRLEAAPADDPLALAVLLAVRACGAQLADLGPVTLTLTSTLPMAAGLGSGAAACTAVVRAVAAHLGRPLAPAATAALVFETEKVLHGTPSGIDNTVIAYGQPVFFIRGRPPEPFAPARPLHFLIGDTGQPSPTRVTVGDVRAAWEAAPAQLEQVFAAIGGLVREARQAIERGQAPGALGALMRANQAQLEGLGVSSPELGRLIAAAEAAGALGAKLSGGGRGGNMIALVTPPVAEAVRAALLRAGAVRVLETVVGPAGPGAEGDA